MLLVPLQAALYARVGGLMNFRNSTLYVSTKDTGHLLEPALSILHAGSIRLHLHTTTGLRSTCITTTARRINQVVLGCISTRQNSGARRSALAIRLLQAGSTRLRAQDSALAYDYLQDQPEKGTCVATTAGRQDQPGFMLSTAPASRLPQAGSTRFHAQRCTCVTTTASRINQASCSALAYDYWQDQPDKPWHTWQNQPG